jgi:putative membrane protein
MMFWDRHHDLAVWWPMGIGLIIWVVVIGLLVWLAVRAMRQRPSSDSSAGDSAEELLRRRFAAGEIDEEEYAKRSEVLRRK